MGGNHAVIRPRYICTADENVNIIYGSDINIDTSSEKGCKTMYLQIIDKKSKNFPISIINIFCI